MNSHRQGKNLKNKLKKQRQSIQKLFNKLRNESCTNDESCNLNDSVIILDNSSSTDNRKRKRIGEISTNNLQNKHQRVGSIVEIKDDDDEEDGDLIILKESTPITSPKQNSKTPLCSTPIPSKTNTKNNLNISNVSIINEKVNNNLDLVQNFNNQNATKEINEESYLTIDLTTSSTIKKSDIIDLEHVADTSDCQFVSLTTNSSNLSLSGESEVIIFLLLGFVVIF